MEHTVNCVCVCLCVYFSMYTCVFSGVLFNICGRPWSQCKCAPQTDYVFHFEADLSHDSTTGAVDMVLVLPLTLTCV